MITRKDFQVSMIQQVIQVLSRTFPVTDENPRLTRTRGNPKGEQSSIDNN